MIHVTPINDINEHQCSVFCECKPKIIQKDGCETIVVHNSYDGREAVEMANEIINPK